MDPSVILFAFGLTLFAGLSTGIGSVMAFFSRDFNPKFLSGSLGFSAGVMIYVSFVEIFVKARESLSASYGETTGYWYTAVAFFAGVAVIAFIDKVIPSYENPHELGQVHQGSESKQDETKRLYRMGLFSALAIAVHNFPEGLATFMGAVADPTLGVSIAVAIAIHNIPEGVAVSIPVYYATKSKKKAFWLSLASGLSEPVGALLGFFLLRSFF
ncbi:MAG: zinc transporter ZupT, partial [Spirochaetota bacterium]